MFLSEKKLLNEPHEGSSILHTRERIKDTPSSHISLMVSVFSSLRERSPAEKDMEILERKRVGDKRSDRECF